MDRPGPAPAPPHRQGHEHRQDLFVLRLHGPRSLVAGPGVWICGKCALIALEILRRTPRAQHRMSPRHRAS